MCLGFTMKIKLWVFCVGVYLLIHHWFMVESNALLRGVLDELSKNNSQTPSSHQPKLDYSKFIPM